MKFNEGSAVNLYRNADANANDKQTSLSSMTNAKAVENALKDDLKVHFHV